MPSPSNENSDVTFVADLMQSAAKVMANFPADFVPPDAETPIPLGQDRLMRGDRVEELLADLQVRTWLNGMMDAWPKEFMPIFLQSSSILAQILGMFSTGHRGGIMNIFAGGVV